MGGKSAKTPNATKWQKKIAVGLFQDTDPIRQALFDRSGDFLSGGMDVRESPSYEALKLATDSSFNQAKDNTIARFAPGGGLIDAITGLEADRAQTMASGAAQLNEQELARAMSLGTGMSQQSLAGLGQAGNVQAQIAQSNAAVTAAGKQAIGSAAGSFLGGK